MSEGSWEQRRFFTIDIVQQNASDIAERFVEFLSKRNIDSGQTIESAERVYKGRQRKAILKATLPKAWNKIIFDPDDLLVNLLIETTEKLSGFSPEVADVEQFLQAVVRPEEIRSTEVESAAITPGGASVRGLPLVDDYINREIESFIFLGRTYRPHTWQDLLVTVASELYKRHRDNFQKCLSLRGSRMVYFSTDRNLLKNPKQIADSQYYAETKLNANSIVRRSRDLMALLGYKDKDLQISIKT